MLRSTENASLYTVALTHFSSAAAIWGKGGALKKLATCTSEADCTNRCRNASADTKGISDQVLARYQANGAGLKQIVPYGHIVACSDCFLKSGAIDDLHRAADRLTQQKSQKNIQIGYAWRSLPTAYVIENVCSKASSNASVAPTGQSRHQRGAAIDIQTTVSSSDECWRKLDGLVTDAGIADRAEALRRIAPEVGEALESDSRFRWAGCGDYMHFNWTGDSGDNGPANGSFQELWNFNSPCWQIVVDGAVGGDTGKALAESPSVKFENTAPENLPANGVQNAGCQIELTPNAAGNICCPGSGGAAPSCRVSCDTADAGANAGMKPDAAAPDTAVASLLTPCLPGTLMGCGKGYYCARDYGWCSAGGALAAARGCNSDLECPSGSICDPSYDCLPLPGP